MPHVARQVVEPRKASLIPERVHGLRGASRLNPRGARSIVGFETTTSRVVRGHFHVRSELVFQVGVAPPGSTFPQDAESIREQRAYDLPASCFAVEQRVDDARHPVQASFSLAS